MSKTCKLILILVLTKITTSTIKIKGEIQGVEYIKLNDGTYIYSDSENGLKIGCFGSSSDPNFCLSSNSTIDSNTIFEININAEIMSENDTLDYGPDGGQNGTGEDSNDTTFDMKSITSITFNESSEIYFFEAKGNESSKGLRGRTHALNVNNAFIMYYMINTKKDNTIGLVFKNLERVGTSWTTQDHSKKFLEKVEVVVFKMKLIADTEGVGRIIL